MMQTRGKELTSLIGLTLIEVQPPLAAMLEICVVAPHSQLHEPTGRDRAIQHARTVVVNNLFMRHGLLSSLPVDRLERLVYLVP